MMNWPEYFLGIAEQVKLKSKDRRTNIGAVIVGEDNEIVSTGYNSFPTRRSSDLYSQLPNPKWYEKQKEQQDDELA